MLSNRTTPNQPDAVNPAIAPWFQAGRQWRGVTDPHRYAAFRALDMKKAMSFSCVAALMLTRGFAAGPELVMQPGMTITAETQTGSISVSAAPDLKRTYTWE